MSQSTSLSFPDRHGTPALSCYANRSTVSQRLRVAAFMALTLAPLSTRTPCRRSQMRRPSRSYSGAVQARPCRAFSGRFVARRTLHFRLLGGLRAFLAQDSLRVLRARAEQATPIAARFLFHSPADQPLSEMRQSRPRVNAEHDAVGASRMRYFVGWYSPHKDASSSRGNQLLVSRRTRSMKSNGCNLHMAPASCSPRQLTRLSARVCTDDRC